MQIGSWIAVYIIIWWICLFAVLPIGARSQSEAGNVVAGTEPGAPAVLRLGRQLLITTLVSVPLMVLLMWGLSNPVLQEYWR
jgi:predicted secreted protein